MARFSTVSLSALVIAVAGPALAQTSPAPPSPAPTTTAPPADAAPMTMPMAPAAAPSPPAAAAPAAPSAPASAPAETVPGSVAAPPPPPLPTTGVGASLIQVLDTVCLPMIRQPGSDPKVIAKAASLRNSRGAWVARPDKFTTLTVNMPSPVNPSACSIDVEYPTGQGQTIIDGLTAWAANQPAPLQQDKTAAVSQQYDGVYTTTNWVGYSAATRMGLAFVEKKKFDGSSMGKGDEIGAVQFSFRALTDQDRTGQ